jgi:hypothetical protein
MKDKILHFHRVGNEDIGTSIGSASDTSRSTIEPLCGVRKKKLKKIQ